MDFERPAELTAYLEELDRFIAAEIQMRKVAAVLFGYHGPKRKRFQGAAS
jgi:hypothetical protein